MSRQICDFWTNVVFRLHYEPWELCLFENIECQWPLFYCFLVINGCFSGNDDDVRRFSKALDRCIIWQDGVPLVPELYALPKEEVGTHDVRCDQY